MSESLGVSPRYPISGNEAVFSFTSDFDAATILRKLMHMCGINDADQLLNSVQRRSIDIDI